MNDRDLYEDALRRRREARNAEKRVRQEINRAANAIARGVEEDVRAFLWRLKAEADVQNGSPVDAERLVQLIRSISSDDFLTEYSEPLRARIEQLGGGAFPRYIEAIVRKSH